MACWPFSDAFQMLLFYNPTTNPPSHSPTSDHLPSSTELNDERVGLACRGTHTKASSFPDRAHGSMGNDRSTEMSCLCCVHWANTAPSVPGGTLTSDATSWREGARVLAGRLATAAAGQCHRVAQQGWLCKPGRVFSVSGGGKRNKEEEEPGGGRAMGTWEL